MIKIDFPLVLTAEEEKRFNEILGDKFDEKLKLIAAVALKEYKELMMGQNVFTRASDIFEYRLLLLIKGDVFEGQVPKGRTVAHLFQITETRAETLIRNTYSRYRFEINQHRDKLLASVLKTAALDDAGWVIKTDESIVNTLNSILSNLPGRLKEISPFKELASTYVIDRDSCKSLCTELDLEIKGKEIKDK